MNYGEVIFKPGTPHEYKVNIIEYLENSFGDKRIQISKLSDGNHVIDIPGRDSRAQFFIPEGDLVAVIVTLYLYAGLKGIDVRKEFDDAKKAGVLSYVCSENFKRTA